MSYDISLTDPSPDQLRAIARTARNSSGSASDDCGPLAYVLHGWRAAAIAFRAQQAALVEAQQPATHVQNPAEIEHVAGDVSKNGPESNMAQQPAPSAAAAIAGEIELIEKAVRRVGITSLLNHGAGSCVFTEGCEGVSQDHLLAYTREIALHCAVALGAHPAVDDMAKELDAARDSLQWYMRRCEQLQRVQHRMRDPERTMVCDILANGSLLAPEGQRYTAPQPSPTPQADSAPAEAVQRIIHLRADRERRVYVAGPMTGLPEYNFPLFNATAARLRSEGWHVENPAEHGHVDGAGWSDYLRWDISRIATCGAIYLLPGWSKSKGATLEVHIAGVLGLQVLLADGAEAPQADSQPAPVLGEPTWTVFNSGAKVAEVESLAEAMEYLTPERLSWQWYAVCVVDQSNMPKARTPAGSVTAPAAGAVAGPVDELAELALLNRLIELGSKAACAHARSNSDDGHKGTAAYVEWQELRAEMGELIHTAYAAAPTPPAQAADRVTAPAGGGVAGPSKWTVEEILDGNRGIRWVTEGVIHGRPTDHDVREYLMRTPAMRGCLCDDCKAFYATTPPAQAADSVLEDAARLDWLEQNIFHRELDEWDSKFGGRGSQSMWVLFAPKGVQGSARKIIDAARKQGGAT